WEVGTWREGRRFENRCCWSADGRLLAMHDVLSAIRLLDPDTGKEVFRLTGPEAKSYLTACITRDYTRLIAAIDFNALCIWDLRLIRRQLQELGMDWDWPAFPAERETSGPTTPLTITVDPGIFRARAFENDAHTVAAYSLLLALAPLNPEAYLERGLAYGRMRQPARAVADYEMFLTLASKRAGRRREFEWRGAVTYGDSLKAARRALPPLLALLDAAPDLIPSPGEYARLCNDLAWQSAAVTPKPVPWDVALR